MARLPTLCIARLGRVGGSGVVGAPNVVRLSGLAGERRAAIGSYHGGPIGNSRRRCVVGGTNTRADASFLTWPGCAIGTGCHGYILGRLPVRPFRGNVCLWPEADTENSPTCDRRPSNAFSSAGRRGYKHAVAGPKEITGEAKQPGRGLKIYGHAHHAFLRGKRLT